MKAQLNRPVDGSPRDRVVIHNYDIWNADATMAKVIFPLLKRFKKNASGCRGNLTEEGWSEVLDKIIWSMEQIASDEKDAPNFNRPEGMTRNQHHQRMLCHISKNAPYTEEEEGAFEEYRKEIKTYNARVQEGCDLLGKYFRVLWD